MKSKLWAGRFNKQTNAEVEQYTASIEFDKELAYEDILGSLAHTAMLVHCKIITLEEGHKLQQGLQQIAENIALGQLHFAVEDEDIHMNIERMLGTKIGELAGKLHTARSRNDQVALDIHLYLRHQLVEIAELLAAMQYTLLTMAREHKDIILPGYTHLQRAQPITLAQHWLAYIAMLQRDFERLTSCWKRVNQSPLGACALAGTTFAIDREYVAQLLGFDGVYINTLDAVSDRDFVIEFVSASALMMMHLSRLSEELVIWSSQEFNFISFDDAFCTGSSIMPQKKNPDVVELGRGKTGRVYGALFSLLTIMKGLPLAYNKDLQEDKEPLFDVVKTLRQTLSIYVPLLASLNVNSAVMYAASLEGYLNATVLAEYLVKKGLTFRAAHEIAGKMVGCCIQKNCNLEDLTLLEMQQFSSVIDEKIYQTLSIPEAIKASDLANKTKSSAVEFQLELQAQHIRSNQEWIATKKDQLTQVYSKFNLPF